jgi:hypothetical protein
LRFRAIPLPALLASHTSGWEIVCHEPAYQTRYDPSKTCVRRVGTPRRIPANRR